MSAIGLDANYPDLAEALCAPYKGSCPARRPTAQLIVEATAPDRPVSLGREQVEVPEMVVGAVRPKWVFSKIEGFAATFRFIPRAGFAPVYHAIVAI